MTQAKPRALLVSDVRGWAFAQAMQDLQEYLGDRLDIEHGYVWEWLFENVAPPDVTSFDIVFLQYHRWQIDHIVAPERAVGALRARWFSPETKGPATQADVDLVNRYRGFQVVTRANFAELEQRCPRARYVTNPVNTRRFPEPTAPRAKIIASWNGNAGHSNPLKEDVKGFYSIIVPVCQKAGVRLEFAEYTRSRKAPSEMPAFYRRANLALCASLYEGASSSVMEAMASGQALITTDCGNAREMRESQLERWGKTGIVIVERNVEAFIEAIDELSPDDITEMGLLNREEIERSWSWNACAEAYLELLMLGL